MSLESQLQQELIKKTHIYSHLVSLPLSLTFSFFLHFNYCMEFNVLLLLPRDKGESFQDLNPLVEKKTGNFS